MSAIPLKADISQCLIWGDFKTLTECLILLLIRPISTLK